MPRFIKLADSYLNVDMIIAFKYSERTNTTNIITPYEMMIEEEGDITKEIMVASYEMTAHDKSFVKDIENRFKIMLLKTNSKIDGLATAIRMKR